MESLKILLTILVGFVRDHAQRARQSATVGASTVEYILIALGGILIAGIVVGAVKTWVTTKTGELG